MLKKVLSVLLVVAIMLPMMLTGVGAADATLVEVVPCKYDYLGEPSNGAFMVNLNGKWGCIDNTGREVVPCKYDAADCTSEDLVSVWIYGENESKRGIFDIHTGKEIIPVGSKYATTEYPAFSEELLAVMDGETEKWGFIDNTGKEVIPCLYDYVTEFSEGLAAVELNGKYGYIDKTDTLVIPCMYGGRGTFKNGISSIADENFKWGYIDKTGKVIVPCKYDDVYGFYEGLSAVVLDGTAMSTRRAEKSYLVSTMSIGIRRLLIFAMESHW